MVVRLSDQIDYLYFYSDELLTIGKSDENSKLFELTSWLQWMSVEGGVGGIEWTSLDYSSTPKVQGPPWQTGFFESVLTDRICKLDFV